MAALMLVTLAHKEAPSLSILDDVILLTNNRAYV
jgi:hypothetical protein